MLAYRSVYLAGPIDNCDHDEIWDWRNKATQLLAPMRCYNPAKRQFNYAGPVSSYCKEVVMLDKAEIEASNALLVHFIPPARGGRMTGTTMEVIHGYAQGKLVVTVCEDAKPSPWLDYHSHKMFHHLEDACTFIYRFYS